MTSVTAPEILIKQPSESLSYAIDFDKLLGGSETIASIVGGEVVITPTGPTISGSVIVGRTVEFRIVGGTDGTRYRVEAKIITSDSNTREGDGILLVQDK